jgi:hypothetical protein
MVGGGLVLRRRVAVSGPCPVDEVWDRYVRPGRWSQWSPQIRGVSYPAEMIAPGTGGVVHGPAGVRVGFRILDVEAAGPVRSWSWVVSVGGVRLRLWHDVEEAGDGGSRTTLTVQGFGPVVVLYLPVAKVALRRLVRR